VTYDVKPQDPADGMTGKQPEQEGVSRLEHQLRTAFRTRASEIPVATPLDLHPRPAADNFGGGRQRRARTIAGATWLIPLGTAIAVLAVIVGALAVAHALPAHQTPSVGPIQKKVPPYYVALMAEQPTLQYPAEASVATVRVTSTGDVVARVRAPKPYVFVSVTAATDDRTFVLFAVGPFSKLQPHENPIDRTYAQGFFILHIRPAAPTPSARAQLTTLSQATIGSGLQVQAMALSPNGQSLATILSDPSRAIGTVVPAQLTIFNMASGAQRTWTREVCAYGQCAPGPIGDGSIVTDANAIQLSWTSDGRYVLFIAGPTGSQVRLLDVDAPGSNLISDSQELPVRTYVRYWNSAVIAPDGKSVFIQYPLNGSALAGTLLRFSATTGKAAAVVNQVRTNLGGAATGSGPDYVLWTNDDGSKLIVLGAPPGTNTGTAGQLTSVPSGQTAGVYSGHRYTPLPWSAGVVDAAW
jgi:hypothetical protein